MRDGCVTASLAATVEEREKEEGEEDEDAEGEGDAEGDFGRGGEALAAAVVWTGVTVCGVVGAGGDEDGVGRVGGRVGFGGGDQGRTRDRCRCSGRDVVAHHLQAEDRACRDGECDA